MGFGARPIHHGRKRVLIDHDIDDRRLTAGKRASNCALKIFRSRDPLAMRAEYSRQCAEIRIVVIDCEEAPAIVLILKCALVAQTLVVKDDVDHGDVLAHRGL